MSVADNIVQAMRQPHSLEAEQAVLGALLMDNDAFDRVSDVVRAVEYVTVIRGLLLALSTVLMSAPE